MKGTDGGVAWLVQQWIAKGDIDYRTAERLIKDEQPIRESIAFHCQQAAEKYLKAFLVWRQVEFPKTHSIGQLLDLVATVAPNLSAALSETVCLTPFGAQVRYPGDVAELLPGQEQELFELAVRTRAAILGELGDGPACR